MPRKETKRLPEDNGQVATAGRGVSDQSVRELAQVFKLLSDETRLRILFYLALSPHGELHVTDLCHRFFRELLLPVELPPRVFEIEVADRGCHLRSP